MHNSVTSSHKIYKNSIILPQRIDFEDTKEEVDSKERVSYVRKLNKVAPVAKGSEPEDSEPPKKGASPQARKSRNLNLKTATTASDVPGELESGMINPVTPSARLGKDLMDNEQELGSFAPGKDEEIIGTLNYDDNSIQHGIEQPDASPSQGTSKPPKPL